MTTEVISFALLLLLVVTIGIRYLELRDLVKAIKAQTDALAMYLGDQQTYHATTSSSLKHIDDAIVRVEAKVDRIHQVIVRFDRRKDIEEALS